MYLSMNSRLRSLLIGWFMLLVSLAAVSVDSLTPTASDDDEKMKAWKDALPPDFDPSLLEGLDGFDPNMFTLGGDDDINPGFSSPKSFSSIRSDMKYITCETCKGLVGHMIKLVGSLEAKYKGSKSTKGKISEVMIDEALDRICDPFDESGEWLLEYEVKELVEEDDEEMNENGVKKSGKKKLQVRRNELNEMGEVVKSRCMDGCYTMAAVCEEIMSDYGTDIVEKLWESQGALDGKGVEDFVCMKLTKKMKGSCGRNAKIISKKTKISAKSQTKEDL